MNALQQTALGNLIATFAEMGGDTKITANVMEAFFGPKLTGTYHDTLGTAYAAALNELEISGAELVIPEDSNFQGLKIGETGQDHFEIKKLNGKPTRKWGHISIYRLETGRYEQTNYIL